MTERKGIKYVQKYDRIKIQVLSVFITCVLHRCVFVVFTCVRVCMCALWDIVCHLQKGHTHTHCQQDLDGVSAYVCRTVFNVQVGWCLRGHSTATSYF